MADLVKTVGIIFQGTDNLSQTSAAIESSLKGISGAANTAAPALDDAAVASNRLGATAGTVGDLARAFQLLAGSLVVKEFVDANVAIENFDRAMTLVSGSTAGAANSLEYVRQISDTLGLEISGTADNFISLSAAAKGTSLEGQATRDIFEAISKAMSLLGKSSAETNGALLAVQQIISKGTVSSEELRGQLGERLPGAFQIAARAMNLTTQELGDFLQAGEITAADFLPRFAAELNKTFGDTTRVSTFNAELNRFINSLKDLATSGVGGGIFGSLTGGLIDLTQFVKTTSVEIDFLGGVFSALRVYLADGGRDTEGFVAALRKIGIESSIANAAITNANESTAEWSRLVRQAATDGVDWSKAANESAAEQKRLGIDGLSAVEALAKAYSDLGLNAKVEIDKYVKGLEVLVSSTESTAEEISSAFKIVIPKITNSEELERFSAAAAQAATDGKITWEQWAVQVDKASESFLKNTGYVKESGAAIKTQSDEVKKQAEEMKKAEEATAKLALELEKLASNERIKTMEFKAQIDVARIQADAEKVKAAFDSINVGIESTGDVLKSMFGLFDQLGNLDSTAYYAVFDQIAKENTLREKSFQLQEKLTQAQIDNLNAQTKALASGDAIIKIDGAGLQPHLEAFMWEILKAVQVKANRDGMAFLLGT